MIETILLWAFGAYFFGLAVSTLVKKVLAWKNDYSLAWADALWESRTWYMYVVWLVLVLIPRKDR